MIRVVWYRFQDGYGHEEGFVRGTNLRLRIYLCKDSDSNLCFKAAKVNSKSEHRPFVRSMGVGEQLGIQQLHALAYTRLLGTGLPPS
jgi:hypothetical protein